MAVHSSAAAIQLSMNEMRQPRSFWPRHMSDWLEAKDRSRLVLWIADTLLVFLKTYGHPISDKLTDQLHEVLATSSSKHVCKLIEQWDVHPSDSIVSCHMHVLLAKQHLLDSHDTSLRMSVVWFAIIFCDVDDGTNKRLPILLEEYRKQLESP